MTIEIWLLSLALAFSAGGDGGRGSPEAIQSVARVGADGFRDENTIHARTEPDHLAVGIAIEPVDGATTGSANAADPLKRLAVLPKKFSPQPLICIRISHRTPPMMLK